MTFKLFLIDSWDWEQLQISIDDEIVKGVKKSDIYSGNYHMCGWTVSMEEIVVVEILASHSNSTLKLSFSD